MGGPETPPSHRTPQPLPRPALRFSPQVLGCRCQTPEVNHSSVWLGLKSAASRPEMMPSSCLCSGAF